jgi:hypothetical protein
MDVLDLGSDEMQLLAVVLKWYEDHPATDAAAQRGRVASLLIVAATAMRLLSIERRKKVWRFLCDEAYSQSARVIEAIQKEKQ